jgi:hypothetical protein
MSNQEKTKPTSSLLTLVEKKYLKQQIKKEKIYLIFCGLDIVIAFGMIIYITLPNAFDTTRLVLAIVLLINARSHLKQYKNIQLLKKLSL